MPVLKGPATLAGIGASAMKNLVSNTAELATGFPSGDLLCGSINTNGKKTGWNPERLLLRGNLKNEGLFLSIGGLSGMLFLDGFRSYIFV